MNLSIIKKYEGFRSHAYPDPLSGGEPWTIGYGTTVYSNGRRVREGDVIDEEKADAELQSHVRNSILPALSKIPGWASMSPNMQVALISFAYNLGPNFYGADGFGTISEVLQERRWADLPNALVLYSNPGSNCHEGLLRRRREEGALWANGLAGLHREGKP